MARKSAARPAPPFETRRYLGLDLSGSRNPRTSLAALEFYPREEKIFLLELKTGIGAERRRPGDEQLLGTLEEYLPGLNRLGVTAPIGLPPCVTCVRRTCPGASRCTVPAVKWMREHGKRGGREEGGVSREPTPYTQRPAEIWVRNHVFPKLNSRVHFEIDETLGGTRAPISARMHYLGWHLPEDKLVEVWPKLTLAILAEQLKIAPRIMRSYRNLEMGTHARGSILEQIIKERGVFIYEGDLQTLSQNLSAFDAFFAAYTALLSDLGQCAKIPKNYPRGAGWVEYPEC